MFKRLMKNRNEKGFTLIELMIVIAIIGILAAIAIPNFLSYRKNAECSAVETDAHNGATQMAAWLAEDSTRVATGWAGLTTSDSTVAAVDDNGTIQATPITGSICDHKGTLYELPFGGTGGAWQ